MQYHKITLVTLIADLVGQGRLVSILTISISVIEVLER